MNTIRSREGMATGSCANRCASNPHCVVLLGCEAVPMTAASFDG